MNSRRVIVIPAIKKNAVIPDQLVKRLAGKTLIQRALDTALAFVPGEDIVVVTDSDEIRLICERNGVRYDYDPQYRINSLNIVYALRPMLLSLTEHYERIVIYRASSPLITSEDIEHAYTRFCQDGNDCLVTVKSVKHRLWHEKGQSLDALLFNEDETVAYIETKALFMLRAEALRQQLTDAALRPLSVTPYFVNDRGLEINSYQDWWLCEKILTSKHVVFVVAGYPAIGMGHIYRGLMLAHEIADHRVTFMCTRESELAAASIAARDYHTKLQQTDDLAADVLHLKPDLVVNDILDTSLKYMEQLKVRGVPVVNFEDEGSGAALADLVVNALYESHTRPDERYLYGFRNFCLRDEFVNATQNDFRPAVKNVLITFGGTDDDDFTRQTLEAVLPLIEETDIELSVVTGPGYVHKESLAQRVDVLIGEGRLVEFTHATNTMSRYMEKADFAICSAGRTAYELTHMRVPAIIMAHHQREDMHAFARPRNGFVYLGIMKPFAVDSLVEAFGRMRDQQYRKELYSRMKRFDFSQNKTHVMQRILKLIAPEGKN